MIYELADDRDLPAQARGEERRMAWRMRARHRLQEPEATVDRASDAEIVALLRACRSARDRLIVLLMARAGLRRGELCGLRRWDVHLLADSRLLGCEVRAGAPACGAPGGQPERGVGQVPSPAGGAAGFSGGAGVRRLRVRAVCGAAGGGESISCWSTCSADRSARRCARTRSTS